MYVLYIGDNFQSSEATSLLEELGAKYVAFQSCQRYHAKFLLKTKMKLFIRKSKNG